MRTVHTLEVTSKSVILWHQGNSAEPLKTMHSVKPLMQDGVLTNPTTLRDIISKLKEQYALETPIDLAVPSIKDLPVQAITALVFQIALALSTAHLVIHTLRGHHTAATDATNYAAPLQGIKGRGCTRFLVILLAAVATCMWLLFEAQSNLYLKHQSLLQQVSVLRACQRLSPSSPQLAAEYRRLQGLSDILKHNTCLSTHLQAVANTIPSDAWLSSFTTSSQPSSRSLCMTGYSAKEASVPAFIEEYVHLTGAHLSLIKLQKSTDSLAPSIVSFEVCGHISL